MINQHCNFYTIICKLKKLAAVVAITFVLGGCYDRTDIEDIKNIALIIVDENTISYCTVTTEPEEKSYGYNVYEVETDDLYYGINSVSSQTGKEASLSHLEAILFTDKCSYEKLKKSVNSLLEGTNSHPKVMTAYIAGDAKSFFEQLNIPSDTSVNKLIGNVFHNRFGINTECTAMEISCALNFDISGRFVPVVYTDDDGNINFSGSMFVNSLGHIYVERSTTQFINASKTKGGMVYIDYENESVPVRCNEINFKTAQQNINCNAQLEIYSQKDDKKQAVSDYAKAVTDDIIAKKNNGFDLLNLQGEITKKFRDIPSFERYIKNNGGVQNWIKNIDVNIEIEVK